MFDKEITELKSLEKCETYLSNDPQYGIYRKEKIEIMKKFDGVGIEDNAKWLITNHPEWFKSYEQIEYMGWYSWFWSIKEERPVWLPDPTHHWDRSGWSEDGKDDWIFSRGDRKEKKRNMTIEEYNLIMGITHSYIEFNGRNDRHYLYIVKQLHDEDQDLSLFDEHEILRESNYKIGISKNPESRIQNLRTSNPNKLELIFKYGTSGVDESKFYEKMCHERFKPFRRAGGKEWFLIPELVMKTFIVDIEKRIVWEKANPELTEKEMNTGLYWVLCLEKWSEQNIMERCIGSWTEEIMETLDPEEVEECKDFIKAEMGEEDFSNISHYFVKG